MDTVKISLIAVIAVLIIAIIVICSHNKKLVKLQDDVCYDLLVDTKERIELVHAMKILSDDQFVIEKSKLIEYIDKLIKAGQWTKYTKRREELKNNDKH